MSDTPVATVQIPAKSKPPLDVEYGGGVYRLPGRIPPSLLTAQAQIKRPTLTTAAQKEEYQKQVGAVVLAAFFENVLPDDFQNVIDLEDIEPVFKAWSDHVELGKAPSSTDS
ncbi:MAG TPA: hypothetical protein VGM94_04975 [Galbitalea sp.]|jgi:hypothetical protein